MLSKGALAAPSILPQISLTMGGNAGGAEVATAVKLFLFVTILSIGPALLLTMTSFTRIIIVFSFLRQAMGVAQAPPNQILIGLSLFLTFFLMSPVFKEVNEQAVKPYLDEKIDTQIAFDNASMIIKKFMFAQTRKNDLQLLLQISKTATPNDINDIPLQVMVPSFLLSELKTAFEIGFLIYLPFVLIDIVVSIILLTMGMMVLPPVVISMPFKLMLFVLVDGWNLVVGTLIGSFR